MRIKCSLISQKKRKTKEWDQDWDEEMVSVQRIFQPSILDVGQLVPIWWGDVGPQTEELPKRRQSTNSSKFSNFFLSALVELSKEIQIKTTSALTIWQLEWI